MECGRWKRPNALKSARGILSQQRASSPTNHCLPTAGKRGLWRGRACDPPLPQGTGVHACLHFALLLTAHCALCNFADSTWDHSYAAHNPHYETGKCIVTRTDHPLLAKHCHSCAITLVHFAQAYICQQRLTVQRAACQVSPLSVVEGNVPFAATCDEGVRLLNGLDITRCHGGALLGLWPLQMLSPVAIFGEIGMGPGGGSCLRLNLFCAMRFEHMTCGHWPGLFFCLGHVRLLRNGYSYVGELTCRRYTPCALPG